VPSLLDMRQAGFVISRRAFHFDTNATLGTFARGNQFALLQLVVGQCMFEADLSKNFIPKSATSL
jgi:hypothetical protein